MLKVAPIILESTKRLFTEREFVYVKISDLGLIFSRTDLANEHFVVLAFENKLPRVQFIDNIKTSNIPALDEIEDITWARGDTDFIFEC
ncbi:hypothetical protein AC249_AIPGENE27893 [Exaiptasia diaphana]|nr:hypothetical protein AC249_AIPGENE27893 [Exaiptasia diaphana]